MINVFLDAQPTPRFLKAMSKRLLGDESTALGALTAPIFILVVSSQGADSIIASMNV